MGCMRLAQKERSLLLLLWNPRSSNILSCLIAASKQPLNWDGVLKLNSYNAIGTSG